MAVDWPAQILKPLRRGPLDGLRRWLRRGQTSDRSLWRRVAIDGGGVLRSVVWCRSVSGRPHVTPFTNRGKKRSKEGKNMATLDWSQCAAVESIPGKVSGAWVFRNSRLPVATVIENLEDLSIEEVMEQFDVTREQITAVLEFVAQSLKVSVPGEPSAPVDVHSF
jgi:uncharacterized protein (DUF433 family)